MRLVDRLERLVLVCCLALAVLLSPLFGGAELAAQYRDLCVRLESQLAELESRGGASAAQMARYDRAIAEQSRHLHAAIAHRNEVGCRQSGFFLFQRSRPLQCDAIESQIRRLEANLERLHAERARMMPRRDGGADAARREILAALARNDCGPRYAGQDAERRGGLFDTLMRQREPWGYDGGYGHGATYRTLCVRSCDGFYWPVSFSTTEGRFGADAEICRASCPGTPVELYVHRNPGEDTDAAVSLAGAPYTELPNAFRFRQEYDPSCACRNPSREVAQGELSAGPADIVAVSADALAPPVLEATGPVSGVPLPRPRPGSPGAAPEVASRSGGDGASESPRTSTSRDGRPVRIVGPGFTYFRPDDD